MSTPPGAPQSSVPSVPENLYHNPNNNSSKSTYNHHQELFQDICLAFMTARDNSPISVATFVMDIINISSFMPTNKSYMDLWIDVKETLEKNYVTTNDNRNQLNVIHDIFEHLNNASLLDMNTENSVKKSLGAINKNKNLPYRRDLAVLQKNNTTHSTEPTGTTGGKKRRSSGKTKTKAKIKTKTKAKTTSSKK